MNKNIKVISKKKLYYLIGKWWIGEKDFPTGEYLVIDKEKYIVASNSGTDPVAEYFDSLNDALEWLGVEEEE